MTKLLKWADIPAHGDRLFNRAMDVGTLHHFRPFFRCSWISVMTILGLRRMDGILTTGWRRFFVSERAIDDETEKKGNRNERGKEEWNYGLASAISNLHSTRAKNMPFCFNQLMY